MKLLFGLALMLLSASAAYAGPSTDFTFQGRMTDEHGLCPDPRTRTISFRLYDAPTNGAPCLWARAIEVVLGANGLFSTVLGDEVGSVPTEGATGRFWSLDEVFDAALETGLYLGITDQGASGEMEPRIRLAPVPHALRAGGVAAPDGDFDVGGTLTATDAEFHAAALSGEVRAGTITVTDTLQTPRNLNVGGVQAAGDVKVSGLAQTTGGLSVGEGLKAATLKAGGEFSSGSIAVTDEITGASDVTVTYTVGGRDPGFPIGAVIMWSGADTDVPEGWHVCDGTDNTYDLRDRFIVGLGGDYKACGERGGEAKVTLKIEELPRHKHKLNYRTFGYTPTHEDLDEMIADKWGLQLVWGDTVSVGGNAAHENRPPYYALFFIQRVK